MSLDPGGTTGWCQLTFDFEGLATASGEHWLREHIIQGQLGADRGGTEREHHQTLWTFLLKHRPDIIICEQFKNYGNEFAKLMSREYIGIVKLYASLFPCRIVWQGSDKKEWADDRKLLSLFLLCTPITRWRHANDALRHLVYWLIFAAPREYVPIRDIIFDVLQALSK